jgi:hypothetical protein
VSQPVRREDSRWEAAADEHRIALATFLDSAERLPAAAWSRPPAPGKWSPAEVAEHLSLSYEALLAELEKGTPMAVRLPAWRVALLRWVLLPHILFHRSFPLRAPSPREVRPGAAPAERDPALARLRGLGERFEHALDRARRAGGGWVTHPYFGRVPPVKALRFCAVHVEHHRRQVEQAGVAASLASR